MALTNTFRRNMVKAQKALRRFSLGIEDADQTLKDKLDLLNEEKDLVDVVEENGNRYFYPTLKGCAKSTRSYIEGLLVNGFPLAEARSTHGFDINLPDDDPHNVAAAQKVMLDRHQQVNLSREADRRGNPPSNKQSSLKKMFTVGTKNSQLTM